MGILLARTKKLLITYLLQAFIQYIDSSTSLLAKLNRIFHSTDIHSKRTAARACASASAYSIKILQQRRHVRTEYEAGHFRVTHLNRIGLGYIVISLQTLVNTSLQFDWFIIHIAKTTD